MNGNVFKEGMGALAHSFPNLKIEFKAFWVFLKDIDNDKFLKAISNIIMTEKEIYPGTNIVALIRDKALSGNRLTAGEAWAIVLKEVSRTGSWGKPKFKDNVISQAVEGVGWKAICESEMIGVERAHFIKIYDSLEKRDREDKLLLNYKNKEFNMLAREIVKNLEDKK